MATEINFTRLRQTKNGVVSHHEITIDINTSPVTRHRFFGTIKENFDNFFKEKPEP